MTPREIIADYLVDYLALAASGEKKTFNQFSDDLIDRLEGYGFRIVGSPDLDFCGQDFMAGELCTRRKGHEGPHVGG